MYQTKKILDYIANSGFKPCEDELVDEFGNIKNLLNSLVKKGFLERFNERGTDFYKISFPVLDLIFFSWL